MVALVVAKTYLGPSMIIVALLIMCMAAAPAKREPPPIAYVALGDSITRGLDASKMCQPAIATPIDTAVPDATSFQLVRDSSPWRCTTII